MRQECQAVIVTNSSGEKYTATHVAVAECFRKVFEDYEVCGKPAVDAAEQARLLPEEPGKSILERLQKVSFPLCAEHWDELQKIQEEE
jgi:hypothetical protein